MSLMPSMRIAGLAFAGLAVMALPAVASAESIVVNASGTVTRTVPVKIGDLNLASTQGRAKLATRINYAAREACHIMPGSALNRTDDAKNCLSTAKADAWSQADSRQASADMASDTASL